MRFIPPSTQWEVQGSTLKIRKLNAETTGASKLLYCSFMFFYLALTGLYNNINLVRTEQQMGCYSIIKRQYNNTNVVVLLKFLS